jgi:transcriptional regulator with XRE-family HTH domain
MNENFYSLSSARLKTERIRLELKQAGAAELCGVSREIWGKYERGVVVPGGEVLFSFAAAGADVQYILTGIRSGTLPGAQVFRPDQINHLDNLERCAKEDQEAIKRITSIAAKAGKEEK